MPETLAAAISAELDRREAAAREGRPDPVFTTEVFATLRGILARHDGGHLCPAAVEQPFAMRLFGPALPYGPDCPALTRIAGELGVPHDGVAR